MAHPELRNSWTNAIARALFAPDSDPGVHVGYDLFSPLAPAAFKSPLDDFCMTALDYGFGSIPRSELNGEGAKLWLAAHKFGLLILQCFKDFDDVTNLEAFQIVKQLRNGNLSRKWVFQTWTEMSRGITKPFVNGAEFLDAWRKSFNPVSDDRAEYDRGLVLDALHHCDKISVRQEEEEANRDAEKVWNPLTFEGFEVYKWLERSPLHGASLSEKIDVYMGSGNTPADIIALIEKGISHSRKGSKLNAFVALWVHSALIKDTALLEVIRTDSSVAYLRRALLTTSAGRKLVRCVHHINQRGAICFDLATEAGWHSYFYIVKQWSCLEVDMRR